MSLFTLFLAVSIDIVLPSQLASDLRHVLQKEDRYSLVATQTSESNSFITPPRLIGVKQNNSEPSQNRFEWNSIDNLVEKANTAIDQGNYVEAEAILQEAIQLQPENYRLYNSLGIVLSELERYEEAIAALSQASTINPSIKAIQENLAVAYYNFALQQTSITSPLESLEIYRQAAQYDSEVLELLLRRANRALNSQNHLQAESLYRIVVEIEPDNIFANNNLAIVLFEQDKVTEAIDLLTELNQSLGNNSIVRDNLSVLYGEWASRLGQQGQLDRAIRLLHDVLDEHPSELAYNNLGVLLMQKGDYEAAINNLWNALGLIFDEVDPEQSDICNNTFPQDDSICSNLTEALNQWGYQLSRKGKVDDAIIKFLTAIRLNKSRIQTYLNLNAVLIEAGRFNQAYNYIQEAISTLPGNAVLLNAQSEIEDAISSSNVEEDRSIMTFASELSTSIPEDILRSTVEIRNSTWPEPNGTGWVIKREGTDVLIITNSHVVEGALDPQASGIDSNIEVAFLDSTGAVITRRASLLADTNYNTPSYTDLPDRLLDLAILRVADIPVDIQPLPLSNKDTSIDSVIRIIGHPQRTGGSREGNYFPESWSVVRGTLSGRNEDSIALDATLANGNSGSPVLDMNHRVVGIVFSVTPFSSEIDATAGIGYAHPTSAILSQLKDWNVQIDSE